ncbi:MAG: nicotinate-nucleotide adenylyltransferase [Gammaproteobacteria bacterium]
MQHEVIGILGGTFDPIHLGHLQIAQALLAQKICTMVYFVPCKIQVLKGPAYVADKHRLAMLQLAIAGQSNMRIDTRELERDTPSYMVETLQSFRRDMPNAALGLILGSDSFATLPRWHLWQQLIQLAHIIVVKRPGSCLPQQGELADWLSHYRVQDAVLLSQKLSGFIWPYDMPACTIASSSIRACIQQHLPFQRYVPDNVAHYIAQHNLYHAN